MTFKHRILGHDLEFRYLTWEEDPGTDRPAESLGKALVSVDGHPVSEEQAQLVIDSLFRGLVQGIWILYQGSRPEDRVWDTEIPWSPPKIKIIPRKQLSEGEDDE
jgi:hypothetical protein